MNPPFFLEQLVLREILPTKPQERAIFHRGFTLIELLVVIAIIALLLSIIVPALRRVKDQARLVVCSNNMHQLVMGVMAYSTDNGGVLPPTIQGRTSGVWTVPNRLNYHTGGNGLNGGSLGRILGDYMPLAKIFSCPLASYDSQDLFPDFNGDMVPYQDMYETGGNWLLNCSYFLLWNYQGFDNDTCEKRFQGPGKNSKHKLIVTDALFYNDTGSSNADMWQSTHPFDGADKNVGNPQGLFYGKVDPTGTKPEMWLNAGYTDGRVDRFRSLDTVEEFTLTHQHLKVYLRSSFY